MQENEFLPACKEYGGHIILFGQTGADTYPKAIELMKEKGLVYIDPCEDDQIMAGQGTIGLEMLEAIYDADVVYIPVGGGGLISGIATAVKELSPKIKVVGVEPEQMNCMSASVAAGRIVKITRKPSIADGLSGDAPGIKAFTVVSKYVDAMITVSEEEIAEATLLVMQRTKMFIEPSAGATVAGLFSKRSFFGKKNICLLSGGNANLKVLADLFLKNNNEVETKNNYFVTNYSVSVYVDLISNSSLRRACGYVESHQRVEKIPHPWGRTLH